MDELTITLSLSEVNAVLGALGTQPYQQVANLVDKITGQAQAQLQAQPQPVVEAEPEQSE